jgi:DNA-binding beta-propeller fold protein YncE
MQTDVKSTAPLSATGPFKDATGNTSVGRCRIKGFHYVAGATAGTVVVTDGISGAVVFTINTPTAANNGSMGGDIPGEGILCETGPYGTVTNTAFLILFYG